MSISTICIVGFPPEALPRELKNLCRYVPGFEGSHVGFVGNTASSLFVKFRTPELAQAAMDAVQGTPFDVDVPQHTLRVEWARREMEVRPMSPLPPALTTPARIHGPGRAVARPVAPAWPHEEVLVTICVLGLRDKANGNEDMKMFFQNLPGYVSLQVNERIDGMFVRFATRRNAEDALYEANASQIRAEWARRNLDDEGYQPGMRPSVPSIEGVSPPSAQLPTQHGGMYAGPPSMRQTAPVQHLIPEPIMTLCVTTIREKGLDRAELQNWFQLRPGFVSLSVNEKIDALFVRFQSTAAAEQALADSSYMHYGADWARRNLDDDLGLRREAAAAAAYMQQPHQLGGYANAAPSRPAGPHSAGCAPRGYSEPPNKRPRPSANGEELNTICILALREKGIQVDELQQWLAARAGFVVLQVNERIDAVFAKYASNADAANVLNEANALNFNAEWARRNLGL